MSQAPDRKPPVVFVSWRMGECKTEVKKHLQPALETLGVKVIVVGELPGGDLKRAVVEGMAEALQQQLDAAMGFRGQLDLRRAASLR